MLAAVGVAAVGGLDRVARDRQRAECGGSWRLPLTSDTGLPKLRTVDHEADRSGRGAGARSAQGHRNRKAHQLAVDRRICQRVDRGRGRRDLILESTDVDGAADDSQSPALPQRWSLASGWLLAGSMPIKQSCCPRRSPDCPPAARWSASGRRCPGADPRQGPSSPTWLSSSPKNKSSPPPAPPRPPDQVVSTRRG